MFISEVPVHDFALLDHIIESHCGMFQVCVFITKTLRKTALSTSCSTPLLQCLGRLNLFPSVSK